MCVVGPDDGRSELAEHNEKAGRHMQAARLYVDFATTLQQVAGLSESEQVERSTGRALACLRRCDVPAGYEERAEMERLELRTLMCRVKSYVLDSAETQACLHRVTALRRGTAANEVTDFEMAVILVGAIVAHLGSFNWENPADREHIGHAYRRDMKTRSSFQLWTILEYLSTVV